MADKLINYIASDQTKVPMLAKEINPGEFAFPMVTMDDQGNVIDSSLRASEAHVGEVGTPADLINCVLVLDTNAYATGDVLAISALLPNVARAIDRKVHPYTIQVVDEDDQGQGLDLLFFRANVSIGTINDAVSISDAGSRDFLGSVAVAAADFVDWGNFRVATIKETDLGWKMGLWEPVAGTRDIYVAAISRGNGTYSTSGLRLKISVDQN